MSRLSLMALSLVLAGSSPASFAAEAAHRPDLAVAPAAPPAAPLDDMPLRAARAAGGVTAGAGLGLLGYAIYFEAAGPVGWAAGLLFFGGLCAYLAHQSLQGEPGPATPPPAEVPAAPPAVEPPSASTETPRVMREGV